MRHVALDNPPAGIAGDHRCIVGSDNGHPNLLRRPVRRPHNEPVGIAPIGLELIVRAIHLVDPSTVCGNGQIAVPPLQLARNEGGSPGQQAIIDRFHGTRHVAAKVLGHARNRPSGAIDIGRRELAADALHHVALDNPPAGIAGDHRRVVGALDADQHGLFGTIRRFYRKGIGVRLPGDKFVVCRIHRVGPGAIGLKIQRTEHTALFAGGESRFTIHVADRQSSAGGQGSICFNQGLFGFAADQREVVAPGNIHRDRAGGSVDALDGQRIDDRLPRAQGIGLAIIKGVIPLTGAGIKREVAVPPGKILGRHRLEATLTGIEIADRQLTARRIVAGNACARLDNLCIRRTDGRDRRRVVDAFDGDRDRRHIGNSIRAVRHPKTENLLHGLPGA